MKESVVVDTSVFIEYLRGSLDDTLSVLILNNQVLLSPIVRFELLAGVRQKELAPLLRLLESLQRIETFRTVNEYERKLLKAKGCGLLGGIPDIIILSDTLAYQARLFSLDQKMLQLAKKLKVSIFEA